MSSYPSHTYQFEYADNSSTSHHSLLNLNHRPYLPQEDHVRAAFFSYSPDVIKHRKRTSRAQRKVLEDAFRQNPKPSQYTRKLLIHQTGMDRRSLQVWFQNRRAKEKKVNAKVNSNGLEPSSNIAADAENQDSQEEEEEFKDSSATLADSPPSASATNEIPEDQINNSDPPITTSSTELPSVKVATASPLPLVSSKRSFASTPGDSLHPPLPNDFVPNIRRGSAPAPLGVNTHPTPTYVTESRKADLSSPYPYYPPTPLNLGDDMYGLRRGSLPASYLPGHANRYSSAHLPSIPSDPNIRRASLERSRLRLSSHPFAWQVASAHDTVSKPYLPRQLPAFPALGSMNDNGQVPQYGNLNLCADRVQNSETLLPQTSVFNNYIPWDGPAPLQSRARYLPMQPQMGHQIGPTEIVPGPLPQPGYSFGTAPAAIPEDDNLNLHDEKDDNTSQYRESQYVPRFSSLASTASTASSVLYPEEQRNELFSGEVYQIPGTWQSDRRASCPAPFTTSFASLDVNSSDPQFDGNATLSTITSHSTATRIQASNTPSEFNSNGYANHEESYAFPPGSKLFQNDNLGLIDSENTQSSQELPLEGIDCSNGAFVHY